jgi:ATP adenylyltransferase
MQVLWAPWRMDYITSGDKGEGCIFCPGDDRGRDKERLILYAGSMTSVMMNKFPYINGHLLVAPVRHIPDLAGLSNEESLALIRTVTDSIEILKRVIGPEGFNIGLNLGKIAGAGVEGHMHFHIVPRWNGDTNYMTVLGEVRVIPEHIEETYEKLRPHFEKL